jgi:hypothetical protein
MVTRPETVLRGVFAGVVFTGDCERTGVATLNSVSRRRDTKRAEELIWLLLLKVEAGAS